jgi:hypothetical protein
VNCPTEPELAALVDGELAESRAHAVRDHAGACVPCRRTVAQLEQVTALVRAPVAGALGRHSSESFADLVLAQLDRPRATRARMWPRVAGFAAVAAALAALALGLVWRHRAPADEWAARGSPPGAPAGESVRRVLLRFGRISGDHFDPITPGATIYPNEVIAAEVGRTGRRPLFLLAFVVDAEGERHWIYPAYEVGAPPPSAEPLPAADVPRVLSTMTRLSGPAAGPARLVAIVLTKPASVDPIESAALEDLSREKLASHFPNALVTETRVVVGGP